MVLCLIIASKYIHITKHYQFIKEPSKTLATAHLSLRHQEGVGVGGQSDQRVEEPDEEYQLWCHPKAVAITRVLP